MATTEQQHQQRQRQQQQKSWVFTETGCGRI